MTRKRKDSKKWIAANDPIFTGDPYDLAHAFLCGYVNELDSFFVDDVSNPEFKFFKPGSLEEARAREALVQVLRSHAAPLDNDFMQAQRKKHKLPSHWQLRTVLGELADLFDEPGKEPRRLPQRKLVFKARSSGRQSHFERDLRLAWFIYDGIAKGWGKESAVAAATQRFGGERAYGFRVWTKYEKVVTAQAEAERREQLDDEAGEIIFD